MKKTFALITFLILCLMLVGCGEESDDMNETEDIDETDDMIVETPAPESTPETEEPEAAEPIPETTMPDTTPETEEPETPEEEAMTASNFQLITIKDFKPYPKELTVNVGTTVRWTTTDENFLHVIAWRGFKGMQLTKDMAEGAEYTFEEPGVIKWFSTAKPATQGTITVEE